MMISLKNDPLHIVVLYISYIKQYKMKYTCKCRMRRIPPSQNDFENYFTDIPQALKFRPK